MTQTTKAPDFFWFLPTHGDGRFLGTQHGGRTVDLPYLQQIALAADNLGYSGVLIPTGKSCEDSWLVAAALAPITRKLKFLVAVRPGLQPPSLAARMTSTLDRISQGRLLINVVTGGDPEENKGDGIFLSHDQRYQVTREFLHVYRRLLAGEKVSYHGEQLRVENAELLFPSQQDQGPPIYFGGSSESAVEVAADHVDTYLTWGEPPAQVAEKVAKVRAKAAEKGREVEFGIRLHVIVRDTEQEAWQAAEQLIAHLDDDTIARAQAIFSRMDSTGQARMRELHGGSRDNLEISPNLWAGIGLVRGGAGTALVGDPQQVAARIREYQAIGIDKFILSGYPHLEDAWSFAERVMPLFLTAEAAVRQGPHGETIGNTELPRQVSAS